MRRRTLLLFALAGLSSLLLTNCGGGNGESTPPASNPPLNPPPPSTANFTLSVSPASVQIARRTSGTLQVSVNSQNGFTGPVVITPTNPPSGVSSAPITVAAGSSGTLTLSVGTSTGSGPFTISLVGTSGVLTQTISVTLAVPLGGGVNTIIPRVSGPNAFPAAVAAYFAAMEADVAPVRLAKCGTASSSNTVEMVFDPNAGSPMFNSTDQPFIIIPDLPTQTSVKHYTDYNVHETAHALQYDLLHFINHRGSQTEIEGFARACTDLVYRDLGLAGRRAPKVGGFEVMLWMDTFRRVGGETITAGGWSQSGSHAQPAQALGEAAYLMAASQTGAGDVNGLVEHENAFFAANPFPTQQNPPSPEDRMRVWDSLSIRLDGQTAGAWMPSEMICCFHNPNLTIGKPHLIAWPVFPQFPAQMMAQAFVVVSNDPSFQPILNPITSGPLTITVKDATPQHNVVLGPLQADFSETTAIADYSLSLQTKAPQGTYTVIVDATVNGTALQQRFVVANIPFEFTGLVNENDLDFPGQYLIAVDNEGNAIKGTLTVTRGKTVFTMPGFAIVQADSSGTFDVTGPSGVSHTYTAPEPWARFIPVE